MVGTPSAVFAMAWLPRPLEVRGAARRRRHLGHVDSITRRSGEDAIRQESNDGRDFLTSTGGEDIVGPRDLPGVPDVNAHEDAALKEHFETATRFEVRHVGWGWGLWWASERLFIAIDRPCPGEILLPRSELDHVGYFEIVIGLCSLPGEDGNVAAGKLRGLESIENAIRLGWMCGDA